MTQHAENRNEKTVDRDAPADEPAGQPTPDAQEALARVLRFATAEALLSRRMSRSHAA